MRSLPASPPKVSVGETFVKTIRLSPDIVAHFSKTAGDNNPLHFDPAHAAKTRFKRVIASGTQTASYLMALTAEFFSARGAVVGLEFNIRFKRPVFADETIEVEWEVVSVEPNSRLGGDIVDMRGCVRNERGEVAVAGRGRVLIAETL